MENTDVTDTASVTTAADMDANTTVAANTTNVSFLTNRGPLSRSILACIVPVLPRLWFWGRVLLCSGRLLVWAGWITTSMGYCSACKIQYYGFRARNCSKNEV